MDREREEVVEFGGMLKGGEMRLGEQGKSYGSKIRRRKGKVWGNSQEDRKRGEIRRSRRRVRDGERKKESFALTAELFQRTGTENFSWFSVELCPSLRSRKRWLITSRL